MARTAVRPVQRGVVWRGVFAALGVMAGALDVRAVTVQYIGQPGQNISLQDLSPDGNTARVILGQQDYHWSATTGFTAIQLPNVDFVVHGWNFALTAAAGSKESPANFVQAMRWTAADGTQALGHLGVPVVYQANSGARDVSEDGAVLVGHSTMTSGATRAFRWTESDDMQPLDDSPVTAYWSHAQGVSANGAHIVGLGKSGFQQPNQAFLWDAAGGTRGLGWLPPEEFGESSSNPLVSIAQSYPYAVSDDGSLAVGFSQIYIQLGGMLPAARSEYLPFVWTPATGMVEANKFLSDEYDFDFPGTITVIADVSADGQAWLARGVNASGDAVSMVVRLDDGATSGDFNGDGSVDGEDLAMWSGHFGEANSATGDGDGDGDADGVDFLAWQRGLSGGGAAAAVPEPAGGRSARRSWGRAFGGGRYSTRYPAADLRVAAKQVLIGGG